MKAASVALGVIAIAGMAWLTFVPQTASNLLIEDATAQTMGNMLGVELSINNLGIPDRLIAVSSTSGMAMIHHPTNIKDLPVPVGRSALAMDAAHIMLPSGEAEHADGTLFPLILTFEKAGDVAIKARFEESEMGSHAGHNMLLTGTEGPMPTIAITATSEKLGWLVSIAVENFTFSQEQADGPHVPGVGHGHIYAGGMKLGRVYGSTYRIGALPKGSHQIRVTLNSNDHRTYMQDNAPISATTLITVD